MGVEEVQQPKPQRRRRGRGLSFASTTMVSYDQDSAEEDPREELPDEDWSSNLVSVVAKPMPRYSIDEMWSSEHMRLVTAELFYRHDVHGNGCIKWHNGECMRF